MYEDGCSMRLIDMPHLQIMGEDRRLLEPPLPMPLKRVHLLDLECVVGASVIQVVAKTSNQQSQLLQFG